MKKGRAGLIFSISVGLTAILAASVSTYAWFQASANATVQAENVSTTITVSKPNDYSFYAYKGNKTDPSHSVTGTWNSDWISLTSSNVAGQTSFATMHPGQTYYFALGLSGLTSGDSVTLKIHQLVSNTIIDQINSTSKHRYVKKASSWDTDVNIGWAINVYTGYTASNTGYSTFITNPATGCNSTGDKFTYSVSNTSVSNNGNNTGVVHGSSDYLYGTIESTATDVITLNTDKTIFTGSASGSTMYVYYAVRYDATVKYLETNTSSSEIPIIDESQFAQNARYFVSNASGDSNCFAGLSFQLVDLVLAF